MSKVPTVAGWLPPDDLGFIYLRGLFGVVSSLTYGNGNTVDQGVMMTPGVKRSRLLLLAATSIIVALVVVVYFFKGILFPLIASGLIALILQPIVRNLENQMPWRRRWPRASRLISVLSIYAVALGVVASLLALIVPPAYRQSLRFVEAAPVFYAEIITTIEGWNQRYIERIPQGLRLRFEESLANAGDIVMGEIQNAFSLTVGAVSGTLTLVIGLVTVPIILFYLLKDQESLAEGMYDSFPSAIRPSVRKIISIITQVIGSYVRAQLFLGVVVGLTVFVGLFVLDVRFSVLLGIVAGVTELIPIAGPLLGASVGILVTLATSPEKVLYVLLLYLGVQLVENVFVVPRIQGHLLHIHPVVMIIIILVGSQVAGFWGVIIGPPLVAAARDVISYLRQEWNHQVPLPEAENAEYERKPSDGLTSTQDENVEPQEDHLPDPKVNSSC